MTLTNRNDGRLIMSGTYRVEVLANERWHTATQTMTSKPSDAHGLDIEQARWLYDREVALGKRARIALCDSDTADAEVIEVVRDSESDSTAGNLGRTQRGMP